MGTIPYLTNTTTGLFKYRRRVPKELSAFIESKEISKSLGTNKAEAVKKALELTNTIDEASELTKLKSIPESVVLDLLSTKLQLQSSTAKPKQDKNKLSYLINLYLEQSNVTPMEYSNRSYFFKSLFPSLLNVLFKSDDMDINSLSYDKLLKVRKLLSNVPNKNYKEYRSADLNILLSNIHKGTLKIPKEHLMAEDTINKSLKRIKSLLLFAKDLGYYTNNIPKTLILQNKGESSSRNEKAILTPEDLRTIFSTANDDLKYIYEVSYYTGMRRSELYKCDVVEVDGVVCFDLRSPKERLKTASSYRLIPVHDKLLYRIDEFKDIMAELKPDWITKYFGRLVKRLLQYTEGKSLYSLRHTFATSLIAKGVQPEVVSELMGHAHSTMTMNRYVKGYPIKVLKEAIDKL